MYNISFIVGTDNNYTFIIIDTIYILSNLQYNEIWRSYGLDNIKLTDIHIIMKSGDCMDSGLSGNW